jgi:hypothetical protein
MKKNFIYLTTLSILFLSFSCRKDFASIPSSGNLFFSADTVFLDTVFTNISSSTYALKVYNKSNKDIQIPRIALGRGENSFYRLNVDGLPGKAFENTSLRAKDSLYILIETTIDADLIEDPVYKDSILFDSGERLQNIKLITLVKDAHFIYPIKDTAAIKKLIDATEAQEEKDAISKQYQTLSRDGIPVPKRELQDNELHFTNEKPYIIYGYCVVPENKTLVIDAGAEIHFHDQAALVVQKNARIEMNGTANEKIILEGDRLEFEFDQNPGQWEGLWLQSGSHNHKINHTRIKNARIGIYCAAAIGDSGPAIRIENTEIYNSSEIGLLASETSMNVSNTVVGNSRKSSVRIEKGGAYEFIHCTFANYWPNGVRIHETLQITNDQIDFDEEGNELQTTYNLTKAHFVNCIITGNKTRELLFSKNETDTFAFLFENCLLKYAASNEEDLYDFENNERYPNIVKDGAPHFRNAAINDFQIGEESEAIEKASLEKAQTIPLDLLGIDRTSNPDIGAYQHLIFDTKEETTN